MTAGVNRYCRLYVGATFSRYLEARAVMDALTAAGHGITHDWTRTDAFGADGHPLPGTAGGYELDPVDGCRHALDDIAAVKRADRLLILASEASCGWPVEVGIAIGAGIPVWLVAPFKYTVFWDLPNVEVFDTVAEPLRRLGADPAPACRCRSHFERTGEHADVCPVGEGGC